MYLLMRNKMIRVSAPIHGGSPVFKKQHDSIGLPASIGKKGYQKGGGGYQNSYQKNLLIQKELYRCNGFSVVDEHIATTIYTSSNTYNNNSSTPYKKSQSNGAPFRTPKAQNQQQRYSPNPKSANSTTTNNFTNGKASDSAMQLFKPLKLNFDKGAASALESQMQQLGGGEPILFAGSKSCVTPSPTELPKPPQNWRSSLLTTNRSKQQQQKQPSSAVVPLDLTHHDSAVLLSIK